VNEHAALTVRTLHIVRRSIADFEIDDIGLSAIDEMMAVPGTALKPARIKRPFRTNLASPSLASISPRLSPALSRRCVTRIANGLRGPTALSPRQAQGTFGEPCGPPTRARMVRDRYSRARHNLGRDQCDGRPPRLALGFPVHCRVHPPHRPSIRFLFVSSEFCFPLLSYPASRQRSCLPRFRPIGP
jgi:hypothetical protein